MSLIKKCAKTFGIAIACMSLFFVTNSPAANLPCVQRLIDWNKSFGTNYVTFRLVSLQSPSNLSVFVPEGKLENQTCYFPLGMFGNFIPYTCLKSPSPANALFSNRRFTHPSSTPSTLKVDDLGYYTGSFGNTIIQPFDASKPLQLTVDEISDFFGTVSMHIIDKYNFTPQCVGDLLVGNDAYGNHWTMSFTLQSMSVVH